jgi:putative peptidoglycan binding protein
MRGRTSLSVTGSIVIGILVAALAGGASFAGRGYSTGPNFTSDQDISYAQRILVRNGYLQAGSYKEGERDQPTIDALRTFQRVHFIRPNGQLDQDTMGELTSHEKSTGEYGTTGTASAGRTSTARAARTMPQTGSPLALQIAIGALFVAVGAALLFETRRKSA